MNRIINDLAVRMNRIINDLAVRMNRIINDLAVRIPDGMMKYRQKAMQDDAALVKGVGG